MFYKLIDKKKQECYTEKSEQPVAQKEHKVNIIQLICTGSFRNQDIKTCSYETKELCYGKKETKAPVSIL